MNRQMTTRYFIPAKAHFCPVNKVRRLSPSPLKGEGRRAGVMHARRIRRNGHVETHCICSNPHNIHGNCAHPTPLLNLPPQGGRTLTIARRSKLSQSNPSREDGGVRRWVETLFSRLGGGEKRNVINRISNVLALSCEQYRAKAVIHNHDSCVSLANPAAYGSPTQSGMTRAGGRRRGLVKMHPISFPSMWPGNLCWDERGP